MHIKMHPPPPELDPEKVKREWVNSMLFNLDLMMPMIPAVMDLAMKMLINETDIEFITSDSPVAIVNQWCMGTPNDGSTALACSGLEIFLPISPRHVVLFYDKDIYNVGRQGSNQVKLIGKNDVHSINGLQLLTADSNLYGKVDEGKIAGLPWHWRELKNDTYKTVRLVSDDGKHQTAHQYKIQPDINLKLSFVRVAQKYKNASPEDKRKSHRHLSSMIQQKLSKDLGRNTHAPEASANYKAVEEI